MIFRGNIAAHRSRRVLAATIVGACVLSAALVGLCAAKPEEKLVARFSNASNVLRPTALSGASIDRSSARVFDPQLSTTRAVDAEPREQKRQWGFGGGGRLAVDFDFTRAPVNQIRLRFRPLKPFPPASLVLRCSFDDAVAAAGREETIIARRYTEAEAVTMWWTVDRPLVACEIELPLGADLIIDAIELKEVSTAPRPVAYILANAIIVPGLVAAVVVLGASAPRRMVLLFIACWAVNAAVIAWLAGLGHSDPVDSYQIVSQAVLDGGVVYAHTDRYNYGLLWSQVVGAVKWIHDTCRLAGPETFHVLLAAVVYLGNLAIGAILFRLFAPLSGILYALMPPVLLLNGFHTAFESTALALGLAAIYVLQDEQRRAAIGWLMLSIGLMSLSLSLKHWLIFWPAWILMWRPFGSWQRRWSYAVAIIAIFLIQFLPFLANDAARYGIMNSVFLHQSVPFGSFVNSVFKHLAPQPVYGVVVQLLPSLWLLMLLSVGWLLRHVESILHLPLAYLLTMTAFSHAVADVYLGPAIIACVVYYRSIAAWLYVAATTVTLLASPHNVMGIPEIAAKFSLPTELHRWDVHQFLLMLLLFPTVWRLQQTSSGPSVRRRLSELN